MGYDNDSYLVNIEENVTNLTCDSTLDFGKLCNDSLWQCYRNRPGKPQYHGNLITVNVNLVRWVFIAAIMQSCPG